MSVDDLLNDAFDEIVDFARESDHIPSHLKDGLHLYKGLSADHGLPYSIDGFFRSMDLTEKNYVSAADQAWLKQLELKSMQSGVEELKSITKEVLISRASKTGTYTAEEWSQVKKDIENITDAYYSPMESKIEGYIIGYGAGSLVHEAGDFLTELGNEAGDFFSDLSRLSKDAFKGIFGFEQCFPAGTLITLADHTQKPIEDIRHGDIVLSHDKSGNLTPSIVDKLFTNTTDAFIRLSFDDRDDLIATPGHHFLTETGDYMEIGHMARLGGGQVRIVDTDGSIITAKAERIIYSAETADMFEQAPTKSIAYSGNTVLKEDHARGWKTYNVGDRGAFDFRGGDSRPIIQ